jgi:predicted NUDIX family NTP pyrophosphohydrolase
VIRLRRNILPIPFPLKKTHALFDNTRTCLKMKRAGVLLYAFRHGELVFLLGRERDVRGWSGGGKWSAFSGKAIGYETLGMCAVREFNEETLGIQILKGDIGSEIKDCLSLKKTNPEHRGDAILYMVETDFDVNVPIKFAHVRSSLLKLDHTFTRFARTKKSLKLASLLQPGCVLSPQLSVRKVSARVGAVLVYIYDSIKKVDEIVEVQASSDAIHATRKINTALRDLYIEMKTHCSRDMLGHMSVTQHYVGDSLVGGNVDKVYLEKSDLRWFSETEVRHILETSPDTFRRFFGLNLPKMIDIIKSGKKNTEPINDACSTQPPSSATAV